MSWLVKEFWPVSGWKQEDLDKLLVSEASLSDLRKKELGILGIVPVVPSSMANHTSSVPTNGRGE